MVGSHVEVAGFRWMVRRLLGDVVCPLVAVEIPVTCEDLTKDGIKWLLDTSGNKLLVLISP